MCSKPRRINGADSEMMVQIRILPLCPAAAVHMVIPGDSTPRDMLEFGLRIRYRSDWAQTYAHLRSDFLFLVQLIPCAAPKSL